MSSIDRNPLSSGMGRLKIHNKGQIVIPADIRKQFDLDTGDELEVTIDEEGIHLYPAERSGFELKDCLHEEYKHYGFPSKSEISAIMEKDLSSEESAGSE